MAPGQYVLDQVEVMNVHTTGIAKEEFEAFYRQKPNRKMLRKFQFFVWWYDCFDENKIQEKKAKRNIKYDRKNAKKIQKCEKQNEKRAKKGKPLKSPKLKDKESPILRESIRDIGEKAVVYDSSLTVQTRKQLNRFLFSKGFFNNVVTDTVTFNKRSQLARVHYHLFPGKPYVISKIGYVMEDQQLGALIFQDTLHRVISTGMQYDEVKLKEEQQRITDHALNNGYFYFETAYLKCAVDSAHNNNSVSINLILKKFKKPYSATNDSMVYVSHPKFKIKNVYIITEPLIGNVQNASFKDTVVYSARQFKFLYNAPPAFRRGVIANNVDIYSGQLYRKDTATLTYKRLLGMGIFRNVSIRFFDAKDARNMLDCYIVCNPLVKQSITAETEGTNTSGNLGIDGNILFQNKNSFKGGELIELKLQAAVIAQKQLNTVDNSNSKAFNTIQFGPELSFSVPRAIFPFTLLPSKKDQQPRTFTKTSVNFQKRPEYSRIITSVNYGFTFRTLNRQLRHDLIPLEIYLVRAVLDPQFYENLLKENDAYLLNAYRDHVTTLIKYSLTYTSKENSVTGSRPSYFARLNLQSSGSVLRGLYKLTDQPLDSNGSYHLFGIPFAQFLKADIDFRTYVPVRKKSRMVYRIAGGIAKPLANLSVIPYEQSFFSGGPNGVRAWRSRTLGPGGYNPPPESTARYDKIGDILLEGNVEYRFHIIRSFFGALFVDAGNIWRLVPDEVKPNAEFHLNTFADQIAIGTGMGIRWDLNFFVLRLDAAFPLKDPKLPAGQRWVIDKKPYEYTVFNFGIGYPF
ncbi:MAG: BamA/TamA family outer membrane protein [bacterium]|nr:BamA/TamA family outer membrane protein [bacterium]